MCSFHEKLKELRTSSNTMQKDLADILGVTPRTFRNYEAGSHEPTFTNLIKLCNYFNVSSDYLLGLSDDPERR